MTTQIQSTTELINHRGKLVDEANWQKIGEVPRNVLGCVLKSPTFINKADGRCYKIDFSAKLSKVDLVAVSDLLRVNMKDHYEAAGWGWNEKKKLRELKDEDARFLILKDDEDSSLVGFVHFRFLLEGVCAVLYCYELQICKNRSRRNLGKRLMTILEMIGRDNKMEFLMLTVLLENKSAYAFYRKIGYIVDETSPHMDIDTDGNDVPYEIMSKRLLMQ